MKKLSAFLFWMLLAGVVSPALADGPPLPGDWTNTFTRNWTNTPPPDWTNRPPRDWTNNISHNWTNRPAGWTNGHSRVVPPRGDHRTPPLPTDVQTTVQQFQQNRDALLNQLKGASDAQREQILAQLEQFRRQRREELGKLREQAHQQAEDMKARLGNPRDRILKQGPGPRGRDR